MRPVRHGYKCYDSSKWEIYANRRFLKTISLSAFYIIQKARWELPRGLCKLSHFPMCLCRPPRRLLLWLSYLFLSLFLSRVTQLASVINVLLAKEEKSMTPKAESARNPCWVEWRDNLIKHQPRENKKSEKLQDSSRFIMHKKSITKLLRYFLTWLMHPWKPLSRQSADLCKKLCCYIVKALATSSLGKINVILKISSFLSLRLLAFERGAILCFCCLKASAEPFKCADGSPFIK